MKLVKSLISVSLLFSLGSYLSGYQSDRVSNQEEIQRINTQIQLQKLEWKAGETTVSKLPPLEFQNMLGSYAPIYEDPDKYIQVMQINSLPPSLDWRNKKGKNYMTSVKNQNNCGGCWAFAPLAAMETVYNIENNRFSTKAMPAATNSWTSSVEIQSASTRLLALNFPNLSEQDLVSCSNAGSCSGGIASYALRYIKDNGIVTENCFSYEAKNLTCNYGPNRDENLFRIKGWGYITQTRVDKGALKSALQKGPLCVFMEVYSDFSHYRSGIYKPTLEAVFKGTHSVTIVGYNEKKKYWICKNSWGEGWGEDGYFKIKMGECSIGKWALKVWGVTFKNEAPILCDLGNRLLSSEHTSSFQVSAYDPDGDVLTYKAQPIPKGASFNKKTGIFRWTPTSKQIGEYSVKFSASDGKLTVSKKIKILVTDLKNGKARF